MRASSVSAAEILGVTDKGANFAAGATVNSGCKAGKQGRKSRSGLSLLELKVSRRGWEVRC